MIKGTTPSYTFTVNVEAADIDAVIVSFGQNDLEVLCKHNDGRHCTVDGNTVTVSLTQEDTFLFEEGCHLQAQVRILKTNGEAVSTKTMVIDDVLKSLNEEVMV